METTTVHRITLTDDQLALVRTAVTAAGDYAYICGAHEKSALFDDLADALPEPAVRS